MFSFLSGNQSSCCFPPSLPHPSFKSLFISQINFCLFEVFILFRYSSKHSLVILFSELNSIFFFLFGLGSMVPMAAFFLKWLCKALFSGKPGSDVTRSCDLTLVYLGLGNRIFVIKRDSFGITFKGFLISSHQPADESNVELEFHYNIFLFWMVSYIL